VRLNESASAELSEISAELGISETEVLRKGLALMRLHANIAKTERQGEKAGLYIQEGEDKLTKLLVV